MTPLWWSLQALRDLEAIREYIAVDSPRYAELVVEKIIAAVERLRAFPESGRVVPERNDPQIREVIVRPYRVVYRYRQGEVEDCHRISRFKTALGPRVGVGRPNKELKLTKPGTLRSFAA